MMFKSLAKKTRETSRVVSFRSCMVFPLSNSSSTKTTCLFFFQGCTPFPLVKNLSKSQNFQWHSNDSFTPTATPGGTLWGALVVVSQNLELATSGPEISTLHCERFSL